MQGWIVLHHNGVSTLSGLSELTWRDWSCRSCSNLCTSLSDLRCTGKRPIILKGMKWKEQNSLRDSEQHSQCLGRPGLPYLIGHLDSNSLATLTKIAGHLAVPFPGSLVKSFQFF